MKKIPLFFLALGLARCACAQQPPLQPGPLLNPVADNTRWTLTTTSKTEDPGKPGKKSQPKAGKKLKANTVIGERMGKLAHTTSVLTNGTKDEEWTDGNLTAILEPGAQDPSFTTGTVDEVPMPSWVSRKNFVEVKTEGKKSYLFFRDRIIPESTEIIEDRENPGQNDPEKSKVEATATIDAETRLPVEVTEGELTTKYKFEPLAPDTVIIPAAIQTALTERAKQMQDTIRQPARP